MRRAAALVAATLALATSIAVVLVSAAGANKGDLDLVSRATGAAGAKGDGSSGVSGGHGASLSDTGDVVAFDSQATNLDPDDADTTNDVFSRDLQNDVTTLASRADGVAGAKGNGNSFEMAISGDGRFIVFISTATNLDPGDVDGALDVFVRDLQADTTTLVSRADGIAGAKGNGASGGASISADGRYVAFWSAATNLDADDADAANDVFVRDLQADTTTLISRADGAAGAKANDDMYEPSISDDGGYVSFYGGASNLDPDDADTTNDVFVRDLQTETTTLVSRADGAAGVKGNAQSAAVPPDAISGDGRYVVFTSNASNLDPDDGDVTSDLFVRDLQSDETTLASRATGAAGVKATGGTSWASISADGRYVAFLSGAANLHPDDLDILPDVFHRDLQTNVTTLVSRAAGTAGEPANGSGSLIPSISGDGRYVTFASDSTNLHPADPDGISDIFRRDVLGVLADPIKGEKANVAPVSGTVKVRRPGSSTFVVLREGDSIPMGTLVDTRNGVVRLTSAANTSGETQTALFKFGLFRLTQGKKAGAFTELTLTGPKQCRKAHGSAASGAAAGKSFKKKKGKGRKLWGSGHGKFKSNGSKGSGSASGTIWQVTDRCDGKTEIRSIQGTVTARDKVRRRTVILHTGQSYVAPGKKKH